MWLACLEPLVGDKSTVTRDIVANIFSISVGCTCASKRRLHNPCAGSSSGGCFGLLRVAGYYSAWRRLLALECPAWDCLLALAFALASTCPVFIHSCFGFLACSSMACKLLKLLCACVAVASSLDIDMPSVDLLPSTMGCLGVPSKHCIFFWANAVLHA